MSPVASKHRYSPLANAAFLGIHLLVLVGIFVMGWSWEGFALAVGLYYLRMFGVTAGYHRYFAHRTYRTSRAFQFFLAFLAQTSAQKGVLWWASHHRVHHKFSDQPGDVHSMKREGFFWAHVGWIVSKEHEATNHKLVSDIGRYPELRFLNRWYLLPPVVMGAILLLSGGWHSLFWGYFVSTVMLWHGTFTINSLCHWMGKKRYVTADESRNSLLLSLLTLGEGWHNNHHYYPRSTAQGFFWWEIDVTFYVLKALSWVGLVWDLTTPSEKVRSGNRVPTTTASGARLRAELPLGDLAPQDAE